MYRLMAIRAI